jgi:hypothetical protein
VHAGTPVHYEQTVRTPLRPLPPERPSVQRGVIPVGLQKIPNAHTRGELIIRPDPRPISSASFVCFAGNWFVLFSRPLCVLELLPEPTDDGF